MSAKRGKFWRISDLAVLFETSQSAIVDACRICAIPILPTGMIFLPTTPGNRSRRDFLGEAHRAHIANERQRARIEARHEAMSGI